MSGACKTLILGVVASAALAVASVALAQTNPTLERRVEQLEQRLEGSGLIGLMNQAETLRNEVASLRGEIEVLQRQIDDLRNQQREIYLDVDNRLRALETNAPTQGDGSSEVNDDIALTNPEPTEPSDTDMDTNVDANTELDANSATSGENAYDQAFETLRSGRYAEASEAFAQFLTDYPDHSLAANARYWLGESHYVVRAFDQALTEFQRVIDEHPDSNKRPDARLKIGFVQFEQGRLEAARKTLEQVISEYPDSTAANLARQRLDQL